MRWYADGDLEFKSPFNPFVSLEHRNEIENENTLRLFFEKFNFFHHWFFFLSNPELEKFRRNLLFGEFFTLRNGIGAEPRQRSSTSRALSRSKAY